ncbi:hypothetical protein GQ457_05G009540 [Hibiscus cannabinus]
MTNAKRISRHFTNDSRCPLCNAQVEDVDHVLRFCPTAHSVWSGVIKGDRIHEFMQLDFKTWIVLNLSSHSGYRTWRTKISYLVLFCGSCGVIVTLWFSVTHWIGIHHLWIDPVRGL